jgi:hypothetical protein
VRLITELCGLRVSVEAYVAPKGIRAPVRQVWWVPPLRWVLNPAGATAVLWLRGQPHSELQGLYNVERSEGAIAKRASEGVLKSAATIHSAASKVLRAGPSA